MEVVQQNLFTHLDEYLPLSLTELEKLLVKILNLVHTVKVEQTTTSALKGSGAVQNVNGFTLMDTIQLTA